MLKFHLNGHWLEGGVGDGELPIAGFRFVCGGQQLVGNGKLPIGS
jgi:hypothetical protein